MHLILPRNDEKRMAHLRRLVKMGTKDIEKGKEYLPRELYDRLNDLSKKFYDTFRELSQCNGRKMVAVAERNKTTQRLCFLVRDVFVMARRKYERGDYDDAILAQHGIPKATIRDTAQKRIWITLAEEILAGDAAYARTHPTILRDPTREDLEAAKEAASEAHSEFHMANTHLGRIQMEMQYLRKQAQALLISAKHAIVAGFFDLKGAHIREVLYAYGYRFKPAPTKKESGLIKLKPTRKSKPGRKRRVPEDHAFNYAPPIARTASKPEQARTGVSEEKTSPVEAPAKAQTMPQSTTTNRTAITASTPITDQALKEAITIEEPARKPKTHKPIQRKANHTPSTKAQREKKKTERQNRKKSRRSK